MNIECPACTSDNVEPIHASFSTYQCLECGEIFDENEESTRQGIGTEWGGDDEGMDDDR